MIGWVPGTTISPCCEGISARWAGEGSPPRPTRHGDVAVAAFDITLLDRSSADLAA